MHKLIAGSTPSERAHTEFYDRQRGFCGRIITDARLCLPPAEFVTQRLDARDWVIILASWREGPCFSLFGLAIGIVPTAIKLPILDAVKSYGLTARPDVASC